MSVNEKILEITEYGRLMYYYLNGGCYIFAKELQRYFDGKIYYLLNEYHIVIKINGKLYDASGNVSEKYKYSRKMTEDEFLSRKKLSGSIFGTGI